MNEEEYEDFIDFMTEQRTESLVDAMKCLTNRDGTSQDKLMRAIGLLTIYLGKDYNLRRQHNHRMITMLLELLKCLLKKAKQSTSS